MLAVAACALIAGKIEVDTQWKSAIATLVSPCEGLGTAGDACPIVLPCSRADWPAIGPSPPTCTVEPLHYFGYNPSAVPVPPSVSAFIARKSGIGNVRYVASTRKWRWGTGCSNWYVHSSATGTFPGGISRERGHILAFGPGGASGRPERSYITATDILLLDANLRILSRAHLTGGNCARFNQAAEDVRLLVVEGDLFASYVTIDHPDRDRGCTSGHWLAKVRLQDDTSNGMNKGVTAVLEQTDHHSGMGLEMIPGKPLWSMRNGGLIVRNGRLTHELVRTTRSLDYMHTHAHMTCTCPCTHPARTTFALPWQSVTFNRQHYFPLPWPSVTFNRHLRQVHTTPYTEIASRNGTRMYRPSPPSLYGDPDHPNKVLGSWHNSIIPIWIPELDGGTYLGVAHRHYLSRPTQPEVVAESRRSSGNAGESLASAAHAHPRSHNPLTDVVWQKARHWGTKPMYGPNGTVLPHDRRPAYPFGSGYRRVLYTLTRDLRIRRHSKEFCLPALEGDTGPNGQPAACEAVQYVHSVVRLDGDAIAMLYGINDCTSARTTMSLSQVDALLEYTFDPPSASQMKQGMASKATTKARAKGRGEAKWTPEEERRMMKPMKQRDLKPGSADAAGPNEYDVKRQKMLKIGKGAAAKMDPHEMMKQILLKQKSRG